jgi:4-hydroxybenzoate polyprenyltransferase
MENKGLFESSIVLFKSRKDIIFGATWTATLATIIAGKGFPPITESFLSIIAVMMIVASVYIYNDVTDREMDAYSEQEKKKGRPIAHGIVSETVAMRFVFITGILGLGICLMLNRVVFSIGFTYYVLVFLYSYPGVRFKSMFVIKNLVTSLLFSAAFLIGGAAVEYKVSQSMLLMAFTYYVLLVLIVPSVADMLDFEEDLAFNVKTLGNSLSWKQNLVLYNIGILVLIVGNALLFFLFDVNYFVPILTIVLGISLMAYSYNLRNESGLTASYKLRPVSYAVLLLNPLLLALGAVF